MQKKKIVVGSIIAVAVVFVGSISGRMVYCNNKLSEMKKMYDRADFLTENLILSEDVCGKYTEQLSAIKANIDNKKYNKDDYALLEKKLNNLENEKDNSIASIDNKEEEVRDLYEKLSSDDYNIEKSVFETADSNLKKSAELKKKEYYNMALSELTDTYELLGANEAIDTTQAEGSTDRMTYEQFLYELNIADNDGAKKAYNWYNSAIDLGISPDESFENTASSVKSGGFENIVAAGSTTEPESTEVADNDTTPANTNSNTSSNTESNSTSADTGSTNTSSDDADNTSADDGSDACLTGEEAEAWWEQHNGGHLTGNSTLSEEELQEAKDQWAETVKAY